MAIQFKFSSWVKFDSVDIEARPSISIGDLKSKIIRLKNLDTCQGFDLVFSDARTGQEFVDEKFKIPSGSCVIIKRVPAGSVPSKNVVHHHLTGNSQAKDTNMVYSSRPVTAQMDDFDDFGMDLYRICKENSSISHNSTDAGADRDHKEAETGYLKLEGSGFSEAIQGDSNHRANGRTITLTNSKLRIDEGVVLGKPVAATPSVIRNQETPSELKCTLCNSFFVDAVIVRCCQRSFCEKCIRAVLMEKAKCPMCSSSKYKVEDLLPNLSLRQTVAHFLEFQILMGDFDNACYHNAPDEESAIEGKDVPCEYFRDSSSRLNKKIKVDGKEFGSSCHPANFDDCQGESHPVFGDATDGLLDSAGKNRSLAEFRRHKKRDRSCYMCGSLDHLIRDCPVAPKMYPMYQTGVMPYHALSWHHINSFASLYGNPMAFNTLMAPDANSYWPSIYGGYPFPRGFMMMGGTTSLPTRGCENVYNGCPDFLDVNGYNKKMKISNNNLRRDERKNDVDEKWRHDGDLRPIDRRMLEARKHPRCKENVKDELHRLDDKNMKLNRFNDLGADELPCSTNLVTKERCGHNERYSRKDSWRMDGCCSDSSSSHRKICKEKEAKADSKGRTKKHHSRFESVLEQSFSSNQKLQLKEPSYKSRCSKHNEKHMKNVPTHDLPQMVGGSNENRDECNHSSKCWKEANKFLIRGAVDGFSHAKLCSL